MGHAPLAPPQANGAQLGVPGSPSGATLHVPREVARSHRSHPPALQALLQQYPSTQNALPHSFAAAQASPFAFFSTHRPPEQ